MRSILIDLYKIKNVNNGLGMFSLNFFEEFIKKNPIDLDPYFLVPPNHNLSLLSNNKFLKTNFQKRYFPILNKKFDIWHSLYQCPSHNPNKNTFQIVTIHDLNFLIEKSLSKSKFYLQQLQKCVDRADLIVSISNYTKRILEDNIKLNHKKVEVIPVGVKLNQYPSLNLPKDIHSPYLFSISEFSFKKNFHALIEMMRFLPEYQLVLAGNNQNNYGVEIKKLISQNKLENKVLLCGVVSDELKYSLYKNCAAFVFPSTAEGFGRPPIEAMLAGKPVFLSKLCSLPEIGGQQAFYFENFNPEEMAQTITINLNKISISLDHFTSQSIEYAQKYSWDNCMNQYLKLYNSIG